MRLGVISDTHGNLRFARQALQELGQIDLLVHAGDHYQDAFALELQGKVPVVAVVGNCDFSEGPQEKFFEIGGKKIFLTHGHRFNVKTTYQNLVYKGQEAGADLVIFGHTHIAEILDAGGLLLFNPGSISRPRVQNRLTYGLIEIKDGQIFPYIYEVKSIK